MLFPLSQFVLIPRPAFLRPKFKSIHPHQLTLSLSRERSSMRIVGFIRYRAVNFQQCCHYTYCSARRCGGCRVYHTKRRCILWRIKRACLRGCYLYVSYVTRECRRDCVYLYHLPIYPPLEHSLDNRRHCDIWYPFLDARFAHHLITGYVIAPGYVPEFRFPSYIPY